MPNNQIFTDWQSSVSIYYFYASQMMPETFGQRIHYIVSLLVGSLFPSENKVINDSVTK